jgi:outer membrane protein assembly factor BamB
VVPLESSVVSLAWETGDLEWSAPLAGAVQPATDGGSVYIASSDTLHALDAATGATRWTTETGDRLSLLHASAAAVLGLGPGTVQAFDPRTGQRLWTQRFPPSGDPVGIAASATVIAVSFREGRVAALAPADGSILWQQVLDGVPSPPAVRQDRVYVGATDNLFHSLDARTGKTKWTWRTGGDVLGSGSQQDRADRTRSRDDLTMVYYASADSVLRAINAGNGHQRWKRDNGTRPVQPPVVLDGSVLVAGLAPSLSSFAPLTGQPQGTYTAPGELLGAPLVAPVLVPRKVGLAVVLRDGRVIALRPTALLFNEGPRQLLQALPGTSLPRERLP